MGLVALSVGCDSWSNPFPKKADPTVPSVGSSPPTSDDYYYPGYTDDTGPFTTDDGWTAQAPTTQMPRGCYFVEDGIGGGGWISHIDPDTWVVTQVTPLQGISASLLVSLTWFDGSWLLALSATDELFRVDVETGAWEALPYMDPVALGLAEDGLWVASDLIGSGAAMRYATIDDLVADSPAQAVGLPDSLWSTRGSVLGGRLYAAWHAADNLEWVPLPGAGGMGRLWPEGVDGWIDGISAFEGAILVMHEPGNAPQIQHFDPESGALVDAWQPPLGMMPLGLWCSAGL